MKKSEENAGKGREVTQKGDGADGEANSSCAGGFYGFYGTCWLRDSQAEWC